ncbi:MAG: HD domain-containing phosphohydrolase [Phycisphaerae bacterium]
MNEGGDGRNTCLDDASGESANPAERTFVVRENSADQLRVGVPIPEDLYGESNVLLLAGGSVITPRFLELLNRRRISTVYLSTPGPQRTDEGAQDDLAKQVDEFNTADLNEGVLTRTGNMVRRSTLSVAALREEAELGAKRHADASLLVNGIYEKTCAGDKASSDVIRQTVDKFLTMMELDKDLLLLVVSMQQPQREYLFDHCVNVSLLSMSMAAQLGWDAEQVMEVGYGALMQDVGMLRVPEDIRMAPRPLTPDERREMERHPYYTLEALERIKGAPQTARFIAYQSHERGDRTGYPKRRSDMFLHPFAKVVAIADAFAAMTRPRPHRKAISPYEAVKTILYHGSRNKYNPTLVRAFLDSVSLFPIGSYVELNDGAKAQVIRANPGVHTRPLVDVLDSADHATGQLIDLSSQPELKVQRALEDARSHGDRKIVAA